MFIHDSAHTYQHEMSELETILPLFAPDAVIVSDNAHATTALHDFCQRQGLDFHLFIERPRRHFYPGAGLGIARMRLDGKA